MLETLRRHDITPRTLLAYLFSGGAGAVVQIGGLYVLTERFGVLYLYSAVIAFFPAVAVSFTLHKLWTFRNYETKTIHKQVGLYVGITAVNIVLNTLFLYVLVDVFGVWYIASQVLVSGFLAVVAFLAYKFKVFLHDTSKKT